eukprot:scaffold113751_cov34-Tisochrysis_lutea.AAC.2
MSCASQLWPFGLIGDCSTGAHGKGRCALCKTPPLKKRVGEVAPLVPPVSASGGCGSQQAVRAP